MNVVIAGGHGKVALLLARVLTGQGHDVRGLIRNPDHIGDLEAVGVIPVVCDLEQDDPALPPAVAEATAAVFAAGAGPGSGAERKWTMDRDGAIRLIDACLGAGVRRYVMVSAMGARSGMITAEGVFGAYLQAKLAADEALVASGLDHTIVRPGGLTDDPGTGHISAAPQLQRGQIPRADVAQVLAAVLAAPSTIGKAFDLVAGTTPISEALAAL